MSLYCARSLWLESADESPKVPSRSPVALSRESAAKKEATMTPTLPSWMLQPKRAVKSRFAPQSILALTAALVAVGLGGSPQQLAATVTAATPSHSTTIALTSDEQRVIVVNREANSISIIRVRNNNGNDVATKIAEIGVGEEPRCVAVSPDDRFAYVTNGISGTISLHNLGQRRVVKTPAVATAPRG